MVVVDVVDVVCDAGVEVATEESAGEADVEVMTWARTG